MIDLVTRYIVAVDNDQKARKERGFERRYVREVLPGHVSLTLDCERVHRFTSHAKASAVRQTIPSSFILEWLLPE